MWKTDEGKLAGLAMGWSAVVAAALSVAACCSTPCTPGQNCPGNGGSGGDSGSGSGGAAAACSVDSALSGPVDGCSAAQLVCGVTGDVLAAVKSADFVPAGSYASKWDPRAAVWLRLLERVDESAPDEVKPAIAGLLSKIRVARQDEEVRRALVAGGDLAKAADRLRAAGGGGC